MRLVILFSVILIVVCNVKAEHLVVGNIGPRTILANEKSAEYSPFPFMKRVKTYFFSDPQNRPIVPQSVHNVMTDCEISTQTADSVLELRDEDASEVAKLVLKASAFLGLLADLERSCDVMELNLSPDHPNVSIVTYGMQTDPYQWRVVFYVSSAIYFSFNLFFVIFGSCETQKWNEVPETKDEEKSAKQLEKSRDFVRVD